MRKKQNKQQETQTGNKQGAQLKTMKSIVASLEHKINTEYIKEEVNSLL